MEVGLYGNTHGQSYRDDVNMFLHHTPVEQMDPIQVALTTERAGIHSIWYPDHVCMPYDSESFHTANVSGQRAYQRRHNMLDAAVVMGAVAVQTTTLKLGTSVLIAPYRHPLSDARQFHDRGSPLERPAHARRRRRLDGRGVRCSRHRLRGAQPADRRVHPNLQGLVDRRPRHLRGQLLQLQERLPGPEAGAEAASADRLRR